MTPGLTHGQHSRARLLRLLDGVDASAGSDRSAPPPERLTVGLAAGATANIASLDHRLWPALAPSVGRSETGACVFLAPERAIAVLPPLPFPRTFHTPGFDTAPLRALLATRPRIGVVLLRLGGYAVGVYEGDELIEARNDSRFVKNRHRKGGQSQRRFDRIREKQVHELFESLCETARARLTPYAGRLDFLAFGGDAHTVQAFLKECAWLKQLDAPRLPRFLTVPEPRHQTLVELPRLLWSSRVITATVGHGGDAGEHEPGDV